jgi:hypothetical protein
MAKKRKRKWGNTNRSRAKVRRWAKKQGLPPTNKWSEINATDTDTPGVYEFEIYLYGDETINPDGTIGKPYHAYGTREDFDMKDLFYARGRFWKQNERGADIPGFNPDFDYMLFLDIDSP